MFVFWLSAVSCWLSTAPSLVRCNLIWFSNSLDVSTFTLEQYHKRSFNTKSILVSITKPTNNRKLYNKAHAMCPIIHVGCGCFWWFILNKIDENLINSLEHWMKMVFLEIVSIFSTYFNWIPLRPVQIVKIYTTYWFLTYIMGLNGICISFSIINSILHLLHHHLHFTSN